MAKTQTQWGQPANYNITPATRNDGDPSALEVDINGNLKTVMPQASVYRVISAASTNAANIKSSAGVFIGGYISNIAAYQIFVKLYNKATSPTVGTDIPVMTFTLQATQSTPLYGYDGGIGFSNGISIAITKFEADSDTTAIGANDAAVNIFYI